MDHVTIFYSSGRKYILFDKQIRKFEFGDDFELFKPHHRKNERIFKLTPEFSKVGGVS